MLAVFDKPETSKHLYFNLNNALHLANPPCSKTYKMAGVYAIYKDDVCYYVGQSKNLPSRIATHIMGKYAVADKIDVYFIGDSNYYNFYLNTKSGQSEILKINEQFLILRKKPIENILVFDTDVDQDYLSNEFQEDEGIWRRCLLFKTPTVASAQR